MYDDYGEMIVLPLHSNRMKVVEHILLQRFDTQ